MKESLALESKKSIKLEHEKHLYGDVTIRERKLERQQIRHETHS